eukprot:5613711-Pleurochrysis_carterae.AAC.3
MASVQNEAGAKGGTSQKLFEDELARRRKVIDEALDKSRAASTHLAQICEAGDSDLEPMNDALSVLSKSEQQLHAGLRRTISLFTKLAKGEEIEGGADGDGDDGVSGALNDIEADDGGMPSTDKAKEKMVEAVAVAMAAAAAGDDAAAADALHQALNRLARHM